MKGEGDIEKVVQMKFTGGSKNQADQLYLVKWSGKPSSENSWVSLEVIKDNVEAANSYRSWLNDKRKKGTKNYKYMQDGNMYYLRMPLSEEDLLQE